MSYHDDDYDDNDDAAVLCCHCHVNPATVKVAFMSESGVLDEHFLCEECASEISPKLTQGLTPEELSTLLKEFFGSDTLDEMIAQAKEALEMGSTLSKPIVDDAADDTVDIVCPYCKTTLKTFHRTGRMGCSRCYKIFRDVCIENMPLPHGDFVAQHTGHKPSDGNVVSERVLHTAQLRSLKKQLNRALEKEDFVAAAKFRDQIKRLG